MTELLVVVVIIGMVATVIAATFSVIVRTTPSTEARVDDSRSLLSLTNWLSQDVSSTAEDGFFFTQEATGCEPTSVPPSKALVELHWTEGANTFVANYRFLSDGSGYGVMMRYSCQLGQPARANRMTAKLQERAGGTLAPAPVEIDEVPTVMSDGLPGHKGMEFRVFVTDPDGTVRELLALDGTTTNVRTTLPPPDGGGGSSNLQPNASPLTESRVAGQAPDTVPIPVSDPNGDPLTVTIDETLPTWLTFDGATNSLTITPPGVAEVATPLVFDSTYSVSDGALSAASTIEVTIDPATSTNQAPTMDPVSPVIAYRSTPFSVILTGSDPEGDPLAISGVALDSGDPSHWNPTTYTGLAIDFSPTAAVAGEYQFVASVTDGFNTVQTTIIVRVCEAEIDSVSPTTVKVKTSNALQNDVTVSVSHNGFCDPLVLAFKPQATQPDQHEEFGTNTSVTIGKNAYTWDTPPSEGRAVTLELRQGLVGPVLDSETLNTTT